MLIDQLTPLLPLDRASVKPAAKQRTLQTDAIANIAYVLLAH